MADQPKREKLRKLSADYRGSTDRIEVYVSKGLRPKFQKAIAPKSMKDSIEEHIRKTIKGK